MSQGERGLTGMPGREGKQGVPGYPGEPGVVRIETHSFEANQKIQPCPG